MKLGKGEVDNGPTITKTFSNGETMTIQKPFAVENGDPAASAAFDKRRPEMYKTIIKRIGESDAKKINKKSNKSSNKS